MGLFTKLFGTRSEREIKKIQPTVDKILAMEEEYKNLSEEELKGKTVGVCVSGGLDSKTICCVLLVIGLVYTAIRKKSFKAILAPIKAIDYETILLLLGLFLVIGGISAQGVIDWLAQLLVQAGGGNLFLMYTVIVWASVLISAFIDNIPYVATMIPVIGSISVALSATMGVDAGLIAIPLYFGLLSGATLGGNCTPIGASANITGIGILRKEGYTVKNGDFFKIGIPFTLAAIVPAYIIIWLFFGV